MKIHVIGGGPAGLYFSLLMKQFDRSHEIHVFERNAADNTFGWGVVFSRRTLEILGQGDPAIQQALQRRAMQWENVDIIHRGVKTSVLGNHFAGISRIDLLQVLQGRCRELGVELHFEAEVTDVRSRQDADLVIGSDGVGSRVRSTFPDSFRPSIQECRNRYIWLGSPRLFHGLTLIFRTRDEGMFMAHAYKFQPDCSTFIVECDEGAWRRAGLHELEEPATLAFLQDVFAEDLDGAPLLSNNSPWIQFLLVKNQQWYHENVALLGDACHTAHFSIGSGTKLALEDSLALFEVFREGPPVPEGLRRYQERRKPVVDSLQEAANSSLHWFETAYQKADWEVIPFAWDCMTRSKRVDDTRLRQRDPAFAARYDEYQRGH